ncbi:N-acetylglucosamine-6-phosphate deacetylase [Ferrimonas sediminicola]|uniref:N-acetylgalactosamine-6-phosphate deacetylase n=1 Tax=Ferrimonas sediminicola TaxID=2569538 RepID=A0A4U1BAY7_9GAMM|nr:N-acetylglucosamine-6-phosphate deacetylase [Ferrimonas sediminicola]TKB47979.1 N-acetylglucosamine-6-phosphate deacetylase [Ferrimonas sediminicola]
MSRRYLVSQLFDGQQMLKNVVLTVERGRVTALDKERNRWDEKLQGILAPGFVDLQVNGGGGLLFNQVREGEQVLSVLRAHGRFGTTAMLPTVISDDLAVMTRAADAVARARQSSPFGILGIHFEGPHLATGKRGVHNPEQMRPIGEAEWQLYARDDLGIKLVTLAPETVSEAEIRTLISLGVIVFLGHSNANADQVERALAAGACGFTHLFNAMSPLASRAPGMVGAALLDEHSMAGLILDGHHMDYRAARLALKCKGRDNLMLVTDAMPPVGGEHHSFELVGRRVNRDGDRLLGPDGELAGSVLEMNRAVLNAIAALDVPPGQALRMASANPARAVGMEAVLGHLKPGALANMVLLGEGMRVIGSWVAGEPLWRDEA